MLNSSLRNLFLGNSLLILCSIFYLVWWLIVFKPESGQANGVSTFAIILAVVFGLAGGGFMIYGFNHVNIAYYHLPSVYIYIGGIALYVIFFLLGLLLKRNVTTELFLIVGWMVLEASLLNILISMGHISSSSWLIAMILLIISGLLSIIAYFLYYHLDPMKSYIDGAIPLLLVCVYMVYSNLLML